MNGTLNKYAYNLTAKVVDKNKYLDGSKRITLRVKEYSGGTPVIRIIELFCDEIGHWSVDTGHGSPQEL